MVTWVVGCGFSIGIYRCSSASRNKRSTLVITTLRAEALSFFLILLVFSTGGHGCGPASRNRRSTLFIIMARKEAPLLMRLC